jgi:hypothetical protein
MRYTARRPIPVYCRNGLQVALGGEQRIYLFLMAMIRPQADNAYVRVISLPKRRWVSTKTLVPDRHALIWAVGYWRNSKSFPPGYSSIKANTCKDLVNFIWTSAKRGPFT